MAMVETSNSQTVVQASAVEIAGRALAIIGPTGSGKSSLALALIDRGARLIGDDAVTLHRDRPNRLIAAPPPNIAGLIELRGIGLVKKTLAPPTPLVLVLELTAQGDRVPDTLPMQEWLGVMVPVLAFDPGTIAPAVRAEHALDQHGRSLSSAQKSLP